jgi:hypothetical protein
MMTLLPVQYNMTAWQKGTWTKTITWLSGGPGSQAVDLSGYTASMTIATDGNSAPLYTLTNTNGGITLGGVAGTIALYIPASEMQSIAAGTYLYQLTVVDSSGNTDPLLWGQFVVKAPTL